MQRCHCHTNAGIVRKKWSGLGNITACEVIRTLICQCAIFPHNGVIRLPQSVGEKWHQYVFFLTTSKIIKVPPFICHDAGFNGCPHSLKVLFVLKSIRGSHRMWNFIFFFPNYERTTLKDFFLTMFQHIDWFIDIIENQKTTCLSHYFTIYGWGGLTWDQCK